MRTVLFLVMGLLMVQALTGCSDNRQANDDPATERSLSYAHLALQRGDSTMARDRLQQMQATGGQEQRRRLLLAEAYLHQGDIDDVVDVLGSAPMSGAAEGRRQLLLGHVALRQARFFDAQVHAKEAKALDSASAQPAGDLETTARGFELLAALDAPGADLHTTIANVREMVPQIHDERLRNELAAMVN